MTIPAQYPNDMLTLKLLGHLAKGSIPLYWFLEQFATDSIYSRKDDFDDGINPNLWVSEGLEWKPDDLQGIIFGGPPGPVSIRGKNFGWQPARRCTSMIGLDLDNLVGKLEFGFAGHGSENSEGGVVIDAATPASSAGVVELAVGVRDTDNDNYFGIVSRGTNNAVGSGTSERSVAVNSGPLTLMVSVNEQTESRLWVNGSLVSIERDGPVARSNLGLWFYSEDITLSVDYIQAWQERVAL